jgi:dipeptidyl aminopeptidase/acylaminoacyl peptidase
LWSVALDERLEGTLGEPVLEAEGGEWPSVARDGALLYAAVGTALWRLAWVSPGGGISALGEPFAPNSWDIMVQLSPDDRQATLVLQGEQARVGELWIADLASGARRRQPTAFEVNSAVWSPDGRGLLATGKDRALVLPVTGGGAARELAGSPTLFQPRYAPDGRWIVGYRIDGTTGRDLWRVAANGRTAEPLLREPGQQGNPDVSPDGRYLAYQSDESGRREIYVRSYPSGPRKWQVSTGGGVSPVWRRSGGELAWAVGNELWAATVTTSDGEPMFAPPRLLARGDEAGLELEPGQRRYGRNFDLSADGRRFLVAQRAAPVRNEVIYVDRAGGRALRR